LRRTSGNSSPSPPDDSDPSNDSGGDGDQSDQSNPRRRAHEHGHLRREIWSKELDEIDAPELTDAEPEDILEFQVLYADYVDKIKNVAQKHNTVIEPKMVYDWYRKA
jgi:hypothetical protein